MRLLVICSTLPPALTPEAAHASHLCDQLALRGVEAHVLTSVGAAASASGAFQVHSKVRGWGWRSLGTILCQMRAIAPDVVLLVHVGWIYGHHPMVTFLPSLARLAVPRARFVTQFENVTPAPAEGRSGRLGRLARWLFRRLPGVDGTNPFLGTLLRRSDRVIVLCQQHLDALALVRPVVKGKTTLIPAPPLMKVLEDPEASLRRMGRARLEVFDASIVLGTFGYVYRSKGLETLVRALGLMTKRSSQPPLRLVVIGGIAEADYGDEIKALARELGVEGQLTWTGHCVPDEDASMLLHAVDVCVFPFDCGVRLHNSSVAVAAAHGRPIVATAGADLEPAFRHGDGLWLCPPRDPSALAAAITAVASDDALRRKLGAGALRLADAHFSWRRVVDATMAALEA